MEEVIADVRTREMLNTGEVFLQKKDDVFYAVSSV